MKAVIMAGGSGTRLWPVSRQNTPKQGQPFGDNETLLQKTYRRLRSGWSPADILVSTGAAQFSLLQKQLPQLKRPNFILETERRDTAPAIGLAATYLHRRNPREIMFTANSDAYLKEVKEYVSLVRTAGKVVTRHPSQTVLIGIKPRFPDTGLGYIKMKRQVETIGQHEVFLVDRFVEKPDQRTAERYAASWQYLWNPAMFVFRVDAMLEKFRRWLNPTYKLLTTIRRAIGTPQERLTVKRLYPKMQKISIDYGIMEKDRAMLVIPADLTWSDIGSWAAVYDMLTERGQANVVRGLHITHDSHGNIIYSQTGKLIATAGVKNMILVETDDAILVCPRNRAQDVKKIVAELERRKLKKYI
ncbi:MAG: mannose-1-phosphate guanylyltransferase [Candidatus Kerfeldbacteria bacterium]|nr:mannose-1-phosphate guanylyltransferase [Candidatus Kerfeldbacteria bacterium]